MQKPVVPRTYHNFPQTRFQGSKYRLLSWFHLILGELTYQTVLDAFSGSGVVSYYFKSQQKQVTSNDILSSSYTTAQALIANNTQLVSDTLLESILQLPNYNDHGHVIENQYDNFYFTTKENIWLDGVLTNISTVPDKNQQAILYWSLFQACIIKRPYNLFHRKNLYMRLDDVSRSFGNKTTWDRPFQFYLRKFVEEANNAVFDNSRTNTALNYDIASLENKNYDLVYLDPPYMKNKKNLSGNDYQDYYHFLEGLLDYDNWSRKINKKLKHNPYTQTKSNWIDPKSISNEFEQLLNKFQDATIVISYNTEGYPSPDELVEMLGRYKSSVEIKYKPIKYALKKRHRKNIEVLIVGKS